MDKVYQQVRVYPLVYGARVYSHAQISHDDTGSAAESESIVVSRSDADTTPKGTDTAAVVLAVSHFDNDVGIGDYDQAVVYSRTDTDSGVADESESTLYAPTDDDSGTGEESETATYSPIDDDSGSSSESESSVQAISDSDEVLADDSEPTAGYDNLFPPFDEWEISGSDGSYIDDDGRLHLIRNDDAIGWARVDRLQYARFFADFMPLGPSEFYDPDAGRHWSVHYYDENLDLVEIPSGHTSNGNASVLEPNVWHERESWHRNLGPDNVTWVRLRIRTSARTADETIINRPQCVASDSSIPVAFPWIPHYFVNVEPSVIDVDDGSSSEDEVPPSVAYYDIDVGIGDYDQEVVYLRSDTDSGVGSESEGTTYAPTDADTGAGEDVELQTYSPTDTDALSGAEDELWAAALATAEDGTASESEQPPTVSITDQEEAGSDESEQLSISFYFEDDDEGTGSDSEEFAVAIESSDDSVTAEFELAHITLSDNDVGFGDYDTAVTYERVDADSGTATEDEDVHYTELNLSANDQGYGEEYFGSLYVVTPTYEDEAIATFDEHWFEVLLDLKATVGSPAVKYEVSEPVVNRW